MGRKKPRQPNTTVRAPAVPATRQSRTWAKHVLAAAALCLVTLVAYSNSFHSGFVVDNRFLILDDPLVHEATSGNIDLIFQHSYWWPTNEVGLYRPVTTLSYLFNYATLGNADRPEGYHWINFFLHFINVVLVYALSLRLLRKFWQAIFIAAVWAVHPVLTESVTNIIGRADLLAAVAILSGLLMYLENTESTAWRRYAWLAGLMVVTAIGAFSKESAVAILGVVVLYEITFWKDKKKDWEQFRAPILGCAAIVIPILAMLYQRATVLAASLPPIFSFLDNPLRRTNFFAARMTAIAVMTKYLWLLVWPAKLSADYSYSQIPIASGTMHDWIAWSTLIVVAAAILGQFSKNRLYFFFGAFAFVTFVPVANLFFQTGTIMAERFLYLPSVGFAVCTVMIVYAVSDRLRVRALAPIALCLLISGFAARTWARNIDWQTDLSIAKASVRASPNSFKAHFDVAVQLNNSDPTGSNLSDVIAEIDKSMAILDSLPNSQNTATVYAEAGRDYVSKGNLLTRNGPDGRPMATPESVQAYNHALQILLKGAEIDRATEADYHEQMRARGRSTAIPVGIPKLYEQLSDTYMRLGDFPKAYDAAVHARLLEPAKIENYIAMGQALVVQGRREAAALVFMEGLLASGNQNLVLTLRELYKTGIDPDGCAIKQTPQGIVLNSNCAPVHRDLCQASAELIKVYKQGQQDDIIHAIRSKAIEQFGCTAEKLD
jgi:tetratricopeptide (TPR) repeat protein